MKRWILSIGMAFSLALFIQACTKDQNPFAPPAENPAPTAVPTVTPSGTWFTPYPTTTSCIYPVKTVVNYSGNPVTLIGDTTSSSNHIGGSACMGAGDNEDVYQININSYSVWIELDAAWNSVLDARVPLCNTAATTCWAGSSTPVSFSSPGWVYLVVDGVNAGNNGPYTLVVRPYVAFTATPTGTLPPTATLTETGTLAPTDTFTLPPTSTPTHTNTASFTETATNLGGDTSTFTPTFSFTPSSTRTFSPTSSHTSTVTSTATITNTRTWTLTRTATSNPSLTPQCQSWTQFGKTSMGGSSGTESGTGFVRASLYTLTQPATLFSMSVYFPSFTPGVQVRLAVYGGSAYSVGTLITQTASAFNPIVGWNTVLMPPTELLAGSYWLAYMVDNDSAFNINWDDGPAGTGCNTSVTWGPFPGTMDPGSNYHTMNIMINASLCLPPFTPTPSLTPTPTFTFTNTYTPSYTPYPGTGIQGTVNAAALGGISSLNPVYLIVSTDPTLASGPAYSAVITTGTAYQMVPMVPGTYYMVVWRDNNPDAGLVDHPRVGDYYQVYNGDGVVPAVDGIAVNAGVITPVNVTLDASYRFNGISGTITYNGPGLVDDNHRLIVQAYTDAAYMNQEPPLGPGDVSVNGGQYEYITFSTDTLYQLAYYDADGNRSLSNGDPFVVTGPFTPGLGTRNIVFGAPGDQNNVWSLTSHRVAGELSYTGAGTVNAAHPIVLAAWDNPTLTNDPQGVYWYNSGNTGGYLLNPPTSGPWHMLAIYLAGGLANDGPSVGDPVYVFNSGCTMPPDGIDATSPAVNDAVLDDSCLMEGIFGLAYYNGALGPVSESARIRTAAYTDPLYQTSAGFQEDVRTNGTRYDLICSAGSTAADYYQLAWLDLNGNHQADVGEPYDALGPFLPGTSTTRDIHLNDDQLWTGRFLQGVVSYAGVVDDAHNVMVHLECSPNFSTDCPGWQGRDDLLTVNGGMFHIPVALGYDTVYAAFVYNAAGVSFVNGPHVGDYAVIYDDLCVMNGTPIGVTGPTLLPDVTIDQSCQMYGVRGNLNYLPGGVNPSHRIGIRVYSDPSRAILIGENRYEINNTRFDVVLFGGATVGSTVYLRAYYDSDDNGYDPGDLYDDAGSATVDYGTGNIIINYSGGSIVP